MIEKLFNKIRERKLKFAFSLFILAAGSLLSLYLTLNINSLLLSHSFAGYQFAVTDVINAVFLEKRTVYMFLIISSIFLVLSLVYFFSNDRPYQSELVEITPDIFTPVPAGQNQHGSAKWLKKESFDREFETFILSRNDGLIKYLIDTGKADRKYIKKDLFNEPETFDGEVKHVNCGGLVIGKKESVKHDFIYYISSDVHAMIVGATRSGKSRTIVLQTIGLLGLAGESMIISDPKGELYNYTQPYLKRLGYKKVIAFDFKNPLRSDRYNFLQPIIDAINQDNISKAVSLAGDITCALVGESKGEKIWHNGEMSTIACCILAVTYDNRDNPEFQNLTNVYYFISEMCKSPDNPKDTAKIIKYVNDLKKTNPQHPAIAAVAISEIAPDKTRGSFYTAALTTLKLFTDPLIYNMTCASDFKPGDTGKESTAVYIILPDHKSTYYPLASLFTGQIYEELVEVADSVGGRLPVRTNFILDEFGNFSKIPDFTNKLTVGGGRGIRFNIFLQSFSQLDKIYEKDDAKTIKGNCDTWIYLKSNDQETRKEVSDRLDKYTTKSYSISASQQHHASGSSSQSVNLIGRELLTPGEVGSIKRPHSLVTSHTHPAIMFAPDLSKWQFNTMFGLGSEKHNTHLRIVREYTRKTRTEIPVALWGIWDQYASRIPRPSKPFI